MNIDNYLDFSGTLNVSGLIFASGSFGLIDGDKKYTRSETEDKTVFEYINDTVKIKSEFTIRKNGVVIRRDSFRNISEKEIEINSLLSRFSLDGNAYEVYTQYSGWQHENLGGWQNLITEIRASSQGVRSCDGASPIMGFHNLYTDKNTVFHLIPNAMWQMSAKKVAVSLKEVVVVETGFHDTGLRLTVHPDETIELPTVIFFSAKSKTDLDAFRLHELYNELCPRKTLPVLYNSWMYCFDKLNIDDLMRQADCASKMGFEGFMIDAGWFGNGDDWFKSVGDWEENEISGPKGRLSELSEYVRKKGMIFGLWFEPERADKSSVSVAKHPEYYIHESFLDFSNPDAVNYILKLLSKQIERYHIGLLKFDFNDSIPIDPSGCGFYRYFQGQRKFISQLREKYPDLYIINCAGGGYRADLSQGMMFDSFWMTDNQGPYEGIRIIKDSLKRMPTALIERWNVQKYCENFPVYNGESVGRMIHCNDATWNSLIGIDDSFSTAFMQGGPIGFSCDIASFPDKYKTLWSSEISKHKKNREFFKNAQARILVDSESIIIIQYSDSELNRCIIQIFTKTVYAKDLIIYPAVDGKSSYLFTDEIISGDDIIENGIMINKFEPNSCQLFELIKI
jgi:alpha-galactosidase